MGTGSNHDLAAPDEAPGVPFMPGDSGAAAAGSQTQAAAPPQGLPPGVRVFMEDLRFEWSHLYALAAGFHRGQVTWTAARRDGLGHVWTVHPARLESLMRSDMRRLPVPAECQGADRLLERFMGRHPGYAVANTGEGFVAWRGDEEQRADGLVELGHLLDGLVTA